MSYQVIEASTHDANTIELFEFTMGNYTWYQTSSIDPYFDGENDYLPNPLERPAIELAGEISRQTIEIGCASSNDVAQLFVAGSPESMVSVRIFQGHRNDGEFVLIFSGRVLSIKWGKQYKASMFCEPIFTSMRRGALKRNFGERCPYVVYSRACGAARNQIAGVIVGAPVGLSLSVDAAASISDGRLIGGTLTVGAIVRTITYHVGSSIKITQPLESSVGSGSTCSILIGCDKSLTACNEWHDNIDNFGAEPYIAAHNPFIGRMV